MARATIHGRDSSSTRTITGGGGVNTDLSSLPERLRYMAATMYLPETVAYADIMEAASSLVEKEERLLALLPYIQHTDGCDLVRHAGPGVRYPLACTCGLAALQSLPKEQGR
jgi:hypothetical protein